MKKLLVGILMLSTVALGIEVKKPKDIKIGITQLMEHSAFDEAREGIIEALTDNGYGDVKIDYQNSQGDFNLVQLIGNKFVKDKKDLIFAISTPSAQAVHNITKDIPILFTAITDPEGAGLVGENISGTTNFLPMSEQLEVIKNLFPNTKKIGIIYNTSEQNSIVQTKRAIKESKNYGLEIVAVNVNSINDIALGLDNLLPKVDILYTITDSMVVSATPMVLAKAEQYKKPVIACIENQVEQGAVLATTLDYRKLGYQTGEMAVDILSGKREIRDIEIEGIREKKIVINEKIAQKYGVDLDNLILKNAKRY